MIHADAFRTAGLVVIEGRSGIGRTVGVAALTTKITGTARSGEGASDINNVVVPQRGVVYIERSGRVWLLADGPVGVDPVAAIWLAAYRESDITDEQTDALAAVEAVLSDVYGIDATDTPDTLAEAATGESAPDPDSEGADDDDEG